MKQEIRCSCKKLICLVEDNDIIIKCRHCKKLLYIHTNGLISMEYKIDDSQPTSLKFRSGSSNSYQIEL